jgi:hypothetical protein
LLTFVEHFLYQYRNQDNRAFPASTESDSIFVTFGVDIAAASLCLWSSNSATLIEAAGGVNVVLNTFVTHLHNSKADISIPTLVVRAYVPREGTSCKFYSDLRDWTQAGSISASVAVSVFIKDPTWQQDVAR